MIWNWYLRPVLLAATLPLVALAALLCVTLDVDGVALGSDFDGATIPNEIGTAEGLPKLIDHLAAAGYGETLLAATLAGSPSAWITTPAGAIALRCEAL